MSSLSRCAYAIYLVHYFVVIWLQYALVPVEAPAAIKFVVCTVLAVAMRDPEFLEAMLSDHPDRIIVSVDARGGKVSLSGWTETSDVGAADAVADLTRRGVDRFLFTPIEVDGTLAGPGFEQLAAVAGATTASVLYSGGVGTLGDLERLRAEAAPNVEGVIVGRALYEGRFTVDDAVSALA